MEIFMPFFPPRILETNFLTKTFIIKDLTSNFSPFNLSLNVLFIRMCFLSNVYLWDKWKHMFLLNVFQVAGHHFEHNCQGHQCNIINKIFFRTFKFTQLAQNIRSTWRFPYSPIVYPWNRTNVQMSSGYILRQLGWMSQELSQVIQV